MAPCGLLYFLFERQYQIKTYETVFPTFLEFKTNSHRRSLRSRRRRRRRRRRTTSPASTESTVRLAQRSEPQRRFRNCSGRRFGRSGSRGVGGEGPGVEQLERLEGRSDDLQKFRPGSGVHCRRQRYFFKAAAWFK